MRGHGGPRNRLKYSNRGAAFIEKFKTSLNSLCLEKEFNDCSEKGNDLEQ